MNDFKAFAVAGGANVLTQAQYLALAALGPGFSAGTANSAELNKVWRQSSIMAAVLATLMENVTGQSSLDDGTTATLVSNLMTTFMKAGYVVDTGVVNAYVATLVPAPLAYYAGQRVSFSTANANTAASTLNVNGLGAIPITYSSGLALYAGSIPANSIIVLTYNPTGPRFELGTKITLGGMSAITNSLVADVLLNNTALYFDGPSVAQGTAGTWFVSGTLTFFDTAIAAFSLKLWDGATVISSARANGQASSASNAVSLSGFITSPTGNLRMSIRDYTSANGFLTYNQSGNLKDCTITAIRIG